MNRNDTALALYREELSIRKQRGREDSAGYVANLMKIGALLTRMGKFDEALAQYQQALAIRKK